MHGITFIFRLVKKNNYILSGFIISKHIKILNLSAINYEPNSKI